MELAGAIQKAACPNDGEGTFGMHSESRASDSWTVTATCGDGSKKTVVVTWG
jgi:hypothetical protein